MFEIRASDRWNMAQWFLTNEAAPRANKLLDIFAGAKDSAGSRSGGMVSRQQEQLKRDGDATSRRDQVPDDAALGAARCRHRRRGDGRVSDQSLDRAADPPDGRRHGNSPAAIIPSIPATDKKDEIGRMARAVLIFKENMIKAKELAEKEAEAIKARIARAARVNELTKAFDASISTVLRSVASASTELQATASSMTATAEETSNQATAVAAATEEASTNVQTVAAAAEELASSVTEISRQVAHRLRSRKRPSRRPTAPTPRCRVSMTDAASIGDVVKLISDIASARPTCSRQCHDRGRARR